VNAFCVCLCYAIAFCKREAVAFCSKVAHCFRVPDGVISTFVQESVFNENGFDG
jgi:hypothetical protein